MMGVTTDWLDFYCLLSLSFFLFLFLLGITLTIFATVVYSCSSSCNGCVWVHLPYSVFSFLFACLYIAVVICSLLVCLFNYQHNCTKFLCGISIFKLLFRHCFGSRVCFRTRLGWISLPSFFGARFFCPSYFCFILFCSTFCLHPETNSVPSANPLIPLPPPPPPKPSPPLLLQSGNNFGDSLPLSLSLGNQMISGLSLGLRRRHFPNWKNMCASVSLFRPSICNCRLETILTSPLPLSSALTLADTVCFHWNHWVGKWNEMPPREREKKEMNTFNFYNLIRLCFFVCLPAYLFSLSLFFARSR